MSNQKQTGRGFGARGYYIALILCATAIGISGYLYYRNMNKPVSNPNEDTSSALIAATRGKDLPVIAQQPSEMTEPPVGTTAPKTTGKLRTVSPVNGETVADYAMDCLSYNETTRDWRVHNGVDIAAEAGTAVVAAANGEVYTVYEDETMGHTVVIRHADGYTTKYACLAETVNVAAGDTVKLGQQIGTVGNSALLESALQPHVHFSVSCDGVDMNPEEFLNMG